MPHSSRRKKRIIKRPFPKRPSPVTPLPKIGGPVRPPITLPGYPSPRPGIGGPYRPPMIPRPIPSKPVVTPRPPVRPGIGGGMRPLPGIPGVLKPMPKQPKYKIAVLTPEQCAYWNAYKAWEKGKNLTFSDGILKMKDEIFGEIRQLEQKYPGSTNGVPNYRNSEEYKALTPRLSELWRLESQEKKAWGQQFKDETGWEYGRPKGFNAVRPVLQQPPAQARPLPQQPIQQIPRPDLSGFPKFPFQPLPQVSGETFVRGGDAEWWSKYGGGQVGPKGGILPNPQFQFPQKKNPRNLQGLPDQLQGGIPMLAEGGVITQGGQAIVGEQGPEVVNLPQGASVAPTFDIGEYIRSGFQLKDTSPAGIEAAARAILANADAFNGLGNRTPLDWARMALDFITDDYVRKPRPDEKEEALGLALSWITGNKQPHAKRGILETYRENMADVQKKIDEIQSNIANLMESPQIGQPDAGGNIWTQEDAANQQQQLAKWQSELENYMPVAQAIGIQVQAPVRQESGFVPAGEQQIQPLGPNIVEMTPEQQRMAQEGGLIQAAGTNANTYTTNGNNVLLNGQVVATAPSPQAAITMAQNSANAQGGVYSATPATGAATGTGTQTGTPTATTTPQKYFYSDEFLGSKANNAAVNQLYQNYFGRDATQAELDNWGENGGADTTVQALEDFLQAEQIKYGITPTVNTGTGGTPQDGTGGTDGTPTKASWEDFIKTMPPEVQAMIGSLPATALNLLKLTYKGLTAGNEALLQDTLKALDDAIKLADPYTKEQIRIVQDEILRGVTSEQEDAASKVGTLQTRIDNIQQDLAFNRDQLSLEEQASLSGQLRQYKRDLTGLQNQMVEAGLAFSSPRAEAEKELATEQQIMAESVRRRTSAALRNLETGSLRGVQEAQQGITDVGRQSSERIADLFREGEQALGSTGVASLPSELGTVTPLGGITGTIEENRQQAILDLENTLLGRLAPNTTT